MRLVENNHSKTKKTSKSLSHNKSSYPHSTPEHQATINDDEDELEVYK
jgi:hypothetical protein